jgi:hypothetical protein
MLFNILADMPTILIECAKVDGQSEGVVPHLVDGMMTHKYRGSQESSREVKPKLLIRHKGRQRTLGSLNSGVVNSAAPGNRLARKSLSVVTVL